MIQAKPIHTDSYFVKAKKVAAFYDHNFFILKIRIENKKQLYFAFLLHGPWFL